MCSSNHAAAERWLSLVRERVGFHTRNYNFTHRYGEILAAGTATLLRLLKAEPDADEARIRTELDDAISTAINNTLLADRWMYLVAERVAYYTHNRRHTERYEELLSAANAALWRLLTDYPEASKAFLRRSLDNAIREADYSDRFLFVPMDTRRKRVARGETPGDIRFDDCDFELHPSPHSWDTWSDVVDTYKTVYALCESEIDQRLIEACWDDGDSYGHGPPHYSNIAERVGISGYKVRQRLDYLEAKYYRLMERPLPTKRRQCRAPN